MAIQGEGSPTHEADIIDKMDATNREPNKISIEGH